MLPFYLILANMGFFGTENAPERPSMSSIPRALNNPIYSVHNYKRPYTGLVETNKKGVVVNRLAAGSTNYKRQRSAEQPIGSVSFVYVPTATSGSRNYKQQNQSRLVQSPQKDSQTANLLSVANEATDSLHQNKQKQRLD